MAIELRVATLHDIPAMHRVRMSMRENRLRSRIGPTDYANAMTKPGKGWVVGTHDKGLGFAVGNRTNGNIWALCADPCHEGRGID